MKPRALCRIDWARVERRIGPKGAVRFINNYADKGDNAMLKRLLLLLVLFGPVVGCSSEGSKASLFGSRVATGVNLTSPSRCCARTFRFRIAPRIQRRVEGRLFGWNRARVYRVQVSPQYVVPEPQQESAPAVHKGYAAVTKEEATAFAQELVERTAQGDVSWYLGAGSNMDALDALYAIAGANSPDEFKDPTDEARDAWKAAREADRRPGAESLKGLKLTEVKAMGNSYVAVFEFTHVVPDKTPPETPPTTHVNLLKKQDTGEIVVVDLGITLL